MVSISYVDQIFITQSNIKLCLLINGKRFMTNGKLNENQARVRFEKKVKELVSTDAPDLWKTSKDGVVKACDEVCGKKKSRRDRGDLWGWNEEVKESI